MLHLHRRGHGTEEGLQSDNLLGLQMHIYTILLDDQTSVNTLQETYFMQSQPHTMLLHSCMKNGQHCHIQRADF